MKIIILVIVIASLGLGFLLGLKKGRLEVAKLRKDNINAGLLDVACYVEHLTYIREGRTNAAVASMDFSMDCLVSHLWLKRAEVDRDTCNRIMLGLNQVRTYRQTWPGGAEERQTIVCEELPIAEINRVHQKAENILTEIKCNNQ